MQKRKRIFTILLALMLCFISVIPVQAATNTQDGVEISVNTDQQSYRQNQNITVSVTVKNVNAFPLEDVTVETIAPTGYKLQGDTGIQHMATLGANESSSTTINAKIVVDTVANVIVNASQTGDGSNLIIWTVFMGIALAVTCLLGFVYRKNKKGLISLLLCLMMLSSLLPANILNVSAANSNPTQSLSVYETVEVDGKSVQIGAAVTYKFPSNEEAEAETDSAANSENTVTPGESETPDSGSGDSGSSETPDSGDSGSSETPDSGNSDSSETPDSGDNGSGDSGSSDTGSGDSGNGDSGSGDSGSGDSGETGSGDSGNDDSGSGESGDTGSGDSGSTTPTYPDNLLTGNWGFENGLADWGTSSMYGASAAANGAYSRSGTGSVYFSIDKDDVQTSAPVLAYGGTREALQPNTEYTFMAWIRTDVNKPLQTDVASDTPGFQVYFRSSDTTETQYNISQPAVADTEGMWQRVSVNFTTKSDVTAPTGIFYIRLKAGTYGGVYVDDVALYKTAEVDFTAPDKEADKGNMLENAYPENLLTGNGGFESGLSDWSTTKLTNWTVTANGEYRHTGSGSALLTTTADNAPAAAVTMSYGGTREQLSANTEYTLMAWVRTEEGKPLQTTVSGGDAGISVYFNSSDTAAKYNISALISDTDGKWQRVSVNFTTKDVTNPTGTIYLRMKEGTYGTVYVDDVALYETAKVNFNAPDTEEGLVSSGDSGSGTAPDYPDNLLTGNGGFEEGLTDWSTTKLTNWTATANGEYSRTGIGSVLLTSTAENAPADTVTMSYGGTRENLSANTEYTLMAWVRTEEDKPLQTTVSGGEAGIAVYFKSDTDTVAKYNISTPVSDTEGKWQRVSVNFTTKDVTNPTGTVYLRMKEGTYGTVYVDDVALYETAKVNFDAPATEEDKGNMLNAYPDNLLTGNGGFEDALDDWVTTKFPSWTVTANKEYSRTGSGSALWSLTQANALTADTTMNYTGGKKALKPNTEYTLMAWVRTESGKPLETTVSGSVGMQLYAKSRYVNSGENDINKLSAAVSDTEGNWQRLSVNFTTKSDISDLELYIYLRFKNGTYGKIYIDDVALYETSKVNFYAPETEADKGKMDVVESDILENYVPLDPTANLFVNGSFENLDANNVPIDGWAGGWYAATGTVEPWVTDSIVQVVAGEAYDGTHSVRLKTSNTEANPWIYKQNAAVVPGEKYVVSVWLKTVEVSGSGPRMKIEFYNAAGDNILSSQSEMFGITNGEWKQKGCTFTAPENAASVKVYIRMYGAGEIYYDKAEMYKYANANKILFDSDTFFYTEWQTGTVGVRMNSIAMTPAGTEVFDIALKDGDTVIKSETGVMAGNDSNFTFDLALLTEKGKEYVIEATLYDQAGGNVLEIGTWPIYRYDRPTMINANGEIVISNETITPVWGYHVYSQDENLKLAKAAGVNVIQGGGASAATAKAYLDLAQANDMYATVLLYSGMKAAGSEGQRETALEIVNAVKDHPALFGYLVMDEPYLHMSDPYDDLVASYKMIRDIDPVHPVIIQDVEATRSTKYTAATSDILVMHHYGCNVRMMPTATEALDTETNYGMEGTTKVIRRMMSDFGENSPVKRKVVHYLGQSFGVSTREEATGYYLPTIDEAKSMIYQALMEGMEGVGYYAFQETGWHVKDTPLYAGLTAFAENELPIVNEAYIGDMHKAAADKSYTILNEYRAIGDGYNATIPEANKDDVWYSIFKENKDDGAWYVLAMNMGEGEKSTNITLASKDSTETLGAYTGVLMDGATTPVTIEGNGSLAITLAPHGTALYKLTEEAQMPQGPTNLLTGNVGFEENVSGWYIAKLTVGDKKWTFSHVDTIDRSENNVNMGCGELYATKEITPDGAVTLSYNNGNDMNNLVVGEEYVFSVWARMDEMLQSADSAITEIGMQLYISNGSKWYGSTEKETQGQWKQYTKVFTADATKPTLYIRIKGPAYGTIYIDDVALYKKSDYDAAQNQ